MQNEYSPTTDGTARDIARSLSSTYPDKGLADTLAVLKQGYENETIQNSDDLFNLFQSSALALDEEVVVRFQEINKRAFLSLSSTTLALKAKAEAMRHQADKNLQQLGPCIAIIRYRDWCGARITIQQKSHLRSICENVHGG